MSRRPRKTVPASQSNAALTPNTDRLKVGDSADQPRPAAMKTRARDRVPFGTYLPADLQRRLKAHCALAGVEMQEAVEDAIRDWLDRQPPNTL